ncbi:MAG: hypothetical protein P8Z41_13735 [Anaerolineales bacterium]|jgi:hypothetical protein
MAKKIWNWIKGNPAWVMLGFTIVFAGVNLLFLGGKFQKERLTQQLIQQVQELESSVQLLQEADREGLQGIQDELIAAQSSLASLEETFPDFETSFDLYRRGFTLATANDAVVMSVHSLGAEVQSTIFGSLEVTSYSVAASADLEQCLAYLASLESEGLETLALNNINIEPDLEACSFDVRIASISPLDVE